MTYKRHVLNKCLIATVIDRYTCMRFAGQLQKIKPYAFTLNKFPLN